MPSQDKLIKQGILLTDTTFDEIIKRLQNGVKTSDTLEAFLSKHKEVIVDNPLVAIGYKDKLTEIILQETNNHKFSRPAQKELTRLTIENRVGDLITNVGDDIKQDVRDIVSDGYNNNLSQNEIANNISDSISKIKNTRARVIARTEIARTATASDYVINRERGATHFKVDCRESCCPVCAERYNWGKNEFSIDDVGMLPPLHPNCRCYAMFFIKDDDEDDVLTRKPPAQTTTTTTTEPTEEQLKENLTPEEYIRYTRTIDRDIENYYKSYTETFKDDKKLVDLFKTKYEDALKEKEVLIEKARTGGDKQEPFSISPLENYSMETLRNDVPINDETFDNLISWSKKRASKNKIEYGYQFDTSTGELIGNEVRGKKGSVTFTQQGTNIGSMHTHPPVEGDVGGGSFPSKQDLKIYRSQRGADHLIGSPTEIWYVHAEENLNSGVLGQREIDAIYTKVYNEVTEKGQELVKQGKLKTDNDSLRKFMDKEIGDGLLREFNTKEWQDKGFYIRRVYR